MANLAKIQPLPQDAPPSLWAPTAGATMDTAPPDMGVTPTPMVSRMPTQGEQNIAHDQARLQKVQWNQEHPWGTPENHPGKLGKVAHAFATLGNIAGNIVAPGVMANIPQTQLGMKAEEGQLAKRVGQEQTAETENQEREALTNKANTETGLEPGKAASLEAEQGAQTENLKGETAARQQALDMGPTLIQGHAHAVSQALKAGRDPATDPLVQQYEDAIQRLQKQPAEKVATPEQQYIDEYKKQHPEAGVAGAVKQYAADTQKPMRISIGQGEAALDRETKQFGASHQKAVDAGSAQLEKINDAKAAINGNAEAQAVGLPKVLTALVSGQGSGVRITQAELNSLAKARGIEGDIEGTLNKWSGKGQLTRTQQQQLSGLLDDVSRKVQQKIAIHNEALDAIGTSGNREAIIKADSDARKKISDMETGGGGNTQTFTDGGVTYNIPKEHIADFKKDHPNAR